MRSIRHECKHNHPHFYKSCDTNPNIPFSIKAKEVTSEKAKAAFLRHYGTKNNDGMFLYEILMPQEKIERNAMVYAAK